MSHKRLKHQFAKDDEYRIALLSNITANQIKEILEYKLMFNHINASTTIGDYDNIVSDSAKFKSFNVVVVFMELCNLVDSLIFKIDTYDDIQFDEILNKAKIEIDLLFDNLRSTSLVLFNKFATVSVHHLNTPVTNKLERLATILNQYLETKQANNIRFIQIDKIIANIGVLSAVNLRFYYSSRALYSVDFFNAYVNYVAPIILAANGRTKKALIFDCDNTLWKGVLGEDGFDNIQMDSYSRDGKFFYEVQTIALSLSKRGILLGLCSKNNEKDVDEVLLSHPGMILKSDDITIKKVNWTDKASNLRTIAKELNIGLDSIVFVDDSDFEINLIREQLPEVTTLQVPKKLYDYPKLIKENLSLFYQLSESKEDLQKSRMYKEEASREREKSKYETFKDYLISLELECKIELNNTSLIPRISQLTQKTNQFNLTTTRYTEKDIENFLTMNNEVYTWSLSDKYGDYGLTGLCILRTDPEHNKAIIDTFLMSCRIIGRNVEYAVMNFIMDELNKAGIRQVESKYIKTPKNSQVATFYDNSSFNVLEQSEKKHTTF